MTTNTIRFNLKLDAEFELPVDPTDAHRLHHALAHALLNALRQHGKDHGASLRTSGASITEVEVRHG